MNIRRLTLTRRQLAHLIAHARAGAPNEVCGLILGRAASRPHDATARGVYRTPNVAREPRVSYLVDASIQVRLFEFADRRGWELLGIYHSHPHGPETPSATDLAQSYYPDAVYLIVSLAVEPPTARAFRIQDGRVEEVSLNVT